MKNQQPTPLRSGPACASVAPLLARRVGQHPLNQQETQTLQAHLETCAACRAELDSYQHLDEVLVRHFAPPENDPLSAEEISAFLEPTAPLAGKAPTLPLKATSRRAVRPLPLPLEPPRRRSAALISALGALAAVVVIAAVGLALFISRLPSSPGGHPTRTPGPTIAGPLLYAVLPGDGTIMALSPSDGSVAWRVSLGAVAPGPVVADGMVYVGTNTFLLYALDAQTGAQRWHYQAGNGFQMAAGNGIVAVKLPDGTLAALRASDGSLLWQKPGIGVGPGSPPLVVNGVVYVSGDQGVWAFTAQTGSQRWHYPITSGEASTMLLADGAVVVLGMDGIFYSIHVSDGSLHWKFTYGALATAGLALAAADGRLYLDTFSSASAQGLQGSLEARSLSTGQRLWGNIPNEGFGFALSAGGGNVYVQVGQTIVALAGATGSRRWATPVAGVYASSLGNGVLYVSSAVSLTNGGVYALKTSDGSITWHAPLGQGVISLALGA